MTEELKNKIDMMSLLQVPYNSEQLLDEDLSNTTTISTDLELSLSWGGFSYTSNAPFLNKNPMLTSYLPDHFLIDSKCEFVKCEVLMNGDKYLLEGSGTEFKSISFNEILFKLLGNSNSFPKQVNMTMTITRTRDEQARTEYFNNLLGGTPEEVLNKVFGSKIKESSLDAVKRSYRGSWGSPFSEGSLKRNIFSNYKHSIAFLIEYFWGKKLPKNATNEQFAKFLASAQNLRFGICDAQAAKKLTEIVRSPKPNVLKSQLESFGIKPATDLSRWYRMGYLEQVDKEEQVK